MMDTSETSSILLQTHDLCKTFQHEGQSIEVLKNLNFSMKEREKVAVVGSSGAGKSTLLHLLGALDHPTSGKIQFQNKDLAKYSERQLAAFRNEKIGFIFQFHHLLKELNALENVMMPSLISRTSRKKALEEAKYWLNEVGLSHRLTHRPSELSGGEQQRVSLARALMNHPLLLLADEPTGNLDQETSQEIHDLLTRVNEEYNTALLIVTHNLELAQLMPRQVRMRNGQLVDQSE